jgi:hypothetical protein
MGSRLRARPSFFVLALITASWLALVVGPSVARAQSETEAREHYERGVALFDEGQFVAALAEFEAAYALSRRAPILFNVGQIHARLGRSVEAVDALERYLAEGGASVAADRRALVEREIATQRGRIATVTVSVSVPGAIVAVDDVEVGTAPLSSPVRVSAGEHVIAARADGFETARYRFRIAGREQRTIALEMVARGEGSARLRIEANVPGVEVRIDGRAVGLTPIDLPIGPHRIEALRPGYEPLDRTIELAPGTEAPLALELVRLANPPAGVLTHVALAVPSTSYTVRVDGELVPGDRLDVPHGLHDLEIQAADMEPIRRRIDVPEGATFELDPGYRWTAVGRQRLHAGAESQRINGIAITVIGAVVGLVGGGLLIGREVQASETRLSLRREIATSCRASPGDCDRRIEAAMFDEPPDDFEDRTNEIIATYEGVGVAGFVLVGAGVATMVGGIVVLATAPSDESIDASTTLRVSLGVGPGSLSLRGVF